MCRNSNALRLFLVVLFLSLGSGVKSQHSRAIGLYIESFTKYFLWPNEPKERLIIGVYGDTDVYPYLQKLYGSKRGKEVRGMQIETHLVMYRTEITNCDVLFVANNKSEELESISTQLKKLPILIVTCVPGFNRAAAINIDTDNAYSLEICSNNIKNTGIKISSSMIRIAEEI